MVGIKSFGVYIPFYRLSREEISTFWGGLPLPGERAVASYDEDAVTMAVEACRDCLKGFGPQEIDELYLASTTFPYGEKQSAALVAAALDLGREVLTIDLAGSLRSGTGGARLAAGAIQGKRARNVLVCASDLRLGLPNGPKELELGDGAAALLLSDSGVVATIDQMYSCSNEIYDVYRPAEERCLRSWEDRFVREKGYVETVAEAVAAALKKFKMTARDFSRAVFSAPNSGYLSTVAKMLGFDLKTQVQDSLCNAVGASGTAQPLLLLAAALEEAGPGEKILWVSYGDGCDVIALTVTNEISRARGRNTVKRLLASKGKLSYQKYLRWRGFLPAEPPARPRQEPVSAVALWRDRKCGMALYGVKCRRCGTVQYPVQRICMECRSKDDFEYYLFADKQGKITTFSHDSLAVSPDPPSTVAVVDFEGGGRIMMDVTDRDPAEVTIGMPVEMTFRKFREIEGISVYWWKCRPVR